MVAPVTGSGRWIGQRTCPECEFSGPETEFIAIGPSGPGDDVAIVHRDDAPEGFALICCGCAASMGRTDHGALRRAVEALIERAS